MLRIKIILEPYGSKEWAEEIGEIEIINDASGQRNLGNYIYELSDRDCNIKGELKGFKRLEKNAFHLLRDVLNKALL